MFFLIVSALRVQTVYIQGEQHNSTKYAHTRL